MVESFAGSPNYEFYIFVGCASCGSMFCWSDDSDLCFLVSQVAIVVFGCHFLNGLSRGWGWGSLNLKGLSASGSWYVGLSTGGGFCYPNFCFYGGYGAALLIAKFLLSVKG